MLFALVAAAPFALAFARVSAVLFAAIAAIEMLAVRLANEVLRQTDIGSGGPSGSGDGRQAVHSHEKIKQKHSMLSMPKQNP